MRPRSRLQSARAAIRDRLGLSTDPRRPSRALFSGIRRRLTLWYSAVVAVLLIAGGTVLYLEVQQHLLGPINRDLSNQAELATQYWQDASANPSPFGPNPCPHNPGDVTGLDPNLLIACYDGHGNLIGAWALGLQFTGAPRDQFRSFLQPSLERSAASGGPATDTVTTPLTDEYASIQRYAVSVPNPPELGKGTLGVVQVGLPVGGQAAALSTLLNLLLILGALTILVSLAAGLFLAGRALQPARIAYARQRDFIADASHEIRTPLTMLRSTVEFVLRGRSHLPPEDVALLEDTVAETTHLTQLANNMLDLARLDSESFHVEEEVVDLSDVAAEIGRWAQSLAREYGVSVSTNAPEPALVIGDGSLLEQAILVVVDNAIKYNEPGGRVLIEVARLANEAVVRVEDSGIGVEAQHLKRLGERFYRVDKARSRESGGAGLGLSIVRSVIARHGGTFDFASQPGTGTTVTIRLKLVAERDIRLAGEEPADAREAAVGGQ